ncbi:MAG: SRPBCC family protein [Gaiellaceae bacterium]
MPAPPERVFNALVTPDELARWWGPKGFTSPSIELDPRAGGSYRIAMQPPEGDLFHLSGEFVVVERPSLLSYTFRWEEPTPDDRETVVTLTLEEADGSTNVILDQGAFATEERLALHAQGWTDSLERLYELVASWRTV